MSPASSVFAHWFVRYRRESGCDCPRSTSDDRRPLGNESALATIQPRRRNSANIVSEWPQADAGMPRCAASERRFQPPNGVIYRLCCGCLGVEPTRKVRSKFWARVNHGFQGLLWPSRLRAICFSWRQTIEEQRGVPPAGALDLSIPQTVNSARRKNSTPLPALRPTASLNRPLLTCVSTTRRNGSVRVIA